MEHHLAVEGHQRVVQHRRTGGKAGPVVGAETALAFLHAAEQAGKLPVLMAQNVDAEHAGIDDRLVRGGDLVDAHKYCRRFGGGRADCGRGHAEESPLMAAGNDADRAGKAAHAQLEL